MLEEITEEKVYQNLKKLSADDVAGTAENYCYEWDENESTSKNLRELAEVMLHRES